MLKLDVTADVAKVTEHLSDLAEKRIPDAAAKALTRTAFDARDAVRDSFPERFNLRRPWISRGIGVTPAQPRMLMTSHGSVVFAHKLKHSGTHQSPTLNPLSIVAIFAFLSCLVSTPVFGGCGFFLGSSESPVSW
jgi:hypothetical protein